MIGVSNGVVMGQSASGDRGAKAKGVNLRRMTGVWVLLVISMTAVALVCWAAMPKGNADARAGQESAAPPDLQEIIWPAAMASARKWRYIVIHHSATPAGTLESIDQGHRDRGFENGAAYHFIISNGRSHGTADGAIAPTARWLEQLDGAHTKVAGHPEFNGEGIGICLIGNFDLQRPTARQMAALQGLVQALRTHYGIPLERIVGHGEVKNTDCPGRLFPMEPFLMDLRQAAIRSRLQNTSFDSD